MITFVASILTMHLPEHRACVRVCVFKVWSRGSVFVCAAGVVLLWRVPAFLLEISMSRCGVQGGARWLGGWEVAVVGLWEGELST